MRLAKIIKLSLTIIILSSLQVSMCDYLAIFGIVPNIVIPFVVSVAVVEGSVVGGVVGLFSGIFIDALSRGTVIANSITYMYLAILCGIISTTYLRRNVGVALIVTFTGTIICEEFIHFLHFAIWGSSEMFSALLNPILPVAVYTTILAVPIYYFTKKIILKNNRRDYL